MYQRSTLFGGDYITCTKMMPPPKETLLLPDALVPAVELREMNCWEKGIEKILTNHSFGNLVWKDQG